MEIMIAVFLPVLYSKLTPPSSPTGAVAPLHSLESDPEPVFPLAFTVTATLLIGTQLTQSQSPSRACLLPHT